MLFYSTGQVGDRAGSGRDVLRACDGASAAITELLALVEDFREEVSLVSKWFIIGNWL